MVSLTDNDGQSIVKDNNINLSDNQDSPSRFLNKPKVVESKFI